MRLQALIAYVMLCVITSLFLPVMFLLFIISLTYLEQNVKILVIKIGLWNT